MSISNYPVSMNHYKKIIDSFWFMSSVVFWGFFCLLVFVSFFLLGPIVFTDSVETEISAWLGKICSFSRRKIKYCLFYISKIYFFCITSYGSTLYLKIFFTWNMSFPITYVSYIMKLGMHLISWNWAETLESPILIVV